MKLLQSRCDWLIEIYQKAVSKLVGKGYNSGRSPLTIDPSTDRIQSDVGDLVPAISSVLPVVEKLEASTSQLWYWLKLIADRLGLKIPRQKEIINSG